MGENQELFVGSNEEGSARELLAKWLKFIFLIQLLNVAVSVLSTLGIPSSIMNLINWVLLICMVYALFRLSAVNERYRKAFIFGLVQLAGMIGNLFIPGSVFSLVVSVGSMVAMYQEYHGHSEVTEAVDAELSGKWHRLFIWQLVVGILVAVGMIGAAVIGIGMDHVMESIVSAMLLLGVLPGIVLEVLYLLYLKRTLALFQAE